MTRTAYCVSDCPTEEGTTLATHRPPHLPRGTTRRIGSGVAFVVVGTDLCQGSCAVRPKGCGARCPGSGFLVSLEGGKGVRPVRVTLVVAETACVMVCYLRSLHFPKGHVAGAPPSGV